MTKRIWVLTDDRAGNNAQALGVAESTGFAVETKRVYYTKCAVLPNFLRGATTLGVARETLNEIKPPYPDFVVVAGRRAAPLARYIKKKSAGKTKIVQLMFPGKAGLDDFDLVVLPAHDGFTQERANVVRYIGAPNRVTDEKLESEKARWADVFEKIPSPRVALIVGGKTKNRPFTAAQAQELARLTNEFTNSLGGASVLATTSRRTGGEQTRILQESLQNCAYFYKYGDAGENPYFALLAYADYIVATGDSMSMCSEACATRAPVYIYAPDGFCAPKHARLHQELYQAGYAAPLDKAGKTALKPHEPLRIAALIAERMKND